MALFAHIGMPNTFFILYMIIKAGFFIEILTALYARNSRFFCIAFNFALTSLALFVFRFMMIGICASKTCNVGNYIVMPVRHQNVDFDLIFTAFVYLPGI